MENYIRTFNSMLMSIHQIKLNAIVKLLFTVSCSSQHFIPILEVQMNIRVATDAVTICVTTHGYIALEQDFF